MREDNGYQLGKVIKTHGLKGNLLARLDVDNPESYKGLESVFIKSNEGLIPFPIDFIQIMGLNAILKPEGIDSIEEAGEFIGSYLYLPLSRLTPLKGGGYYYHQLIGCVVMEHEKKIGTVQSIVDLSENPLLQVTGCNDEEILIPMNPEIMRKVDISSKEVTVSLPNGLLDVYSSSK